MRIKGKYHMEEDILVIHVILLDGHFLDDLHKQLKNKLNLIQQGEYIFAFGQ